MFEQRKTNDFSDVKCYYIIELSTIYSRSSFHVFCITACTVIAYKLLYKPTAKAIGKGQIDPHILEAS